MQIQTDTSWLTQTNISIEFDPTNYDSFNFEIFSSRFTLPYLNGIKKKKE